MQNEPYGLLQRDASLGIVQNIPTQFDDPFYRYLAQRDDIGLMVYYYAANDIDRGEDPEIGRKVGWGAELNRGYSALFLKGASPFQLARRAVDAGHDLLVVSGYNQAHALCTALLARLKGVPVGLRSDNVLPASGGRRRFWLLKTLFYPLLFKLYATAHPVGRQAGEYLTRFGFDAESLFCFPYGVDHPWFARESARARADLVALRSSWGLPAAGPVICGVMKFAPREDPLALVNAFKLAKQRIPELNLLLVGDGPLKKEVEEAAGNDLGRSILLPGYLQYSLLPAAYAASDLFVHPASGAWEVSVNEALACGLPVIASDAVGSAPELVLPQRFGCTFHRGDAHELAERIVEVLDDSEMTARTREHAMDALKEWDYPATAERLIAAAQYAKRIQHCS
jgi:glycosyltransferase involved in cell wall biosynthesis